MLDLSIEELEIAVGGTLRLSEMPPVGGVWEPIFRVVLSCYEAQRGDLFWQLDDSQGDAFAAMQEAFARGALGCVTSAHRPLPWAGAFSLEVNDPAESMWQLAEQLRSRYRGSLIATMGERSSETTQLIYDVVASQFNTTLCLASLSYPQLPLEMLQLESLDDFAVIELTPEKNAAFLRLCSPGVVVITPPTSDDELHRTRLLIEQLEAWQLAVIVGSCDALQRDVARARCQTAWFACDTQQRSRKAFSKDRSLPLTAAIAVGQLLGISSAEIADALDAPLRSLTPLPISKAA